MRHVDEAVVALTCDNVTELDFDELYAALGRTHHRAQIVYDVDRHKPAAIYCSGIQILNPSQIVAAVQEDGDFYDVWRGLIKLGQLKVSRRQRAKWFTIDTIEQLVGGRQHSHCCCHGWSTGPADAVAALSLAQRDFHRRETAARVVRNQEKALSG